MTEIPQKAWICTVCGYIHYGPQPPDECPVCGSLKDEFEPYLATPVIQPVAAQPTLKVVIVGAGIAGVSAAEAVYAAAPQAEINLLSAEVDLPYYRLSLTRYLAGEIDATALELHPEDWYAEHCIRLVRGASLAGIDLPGKQVILQDERRMLFDKLILTVGSHPFVPPFPGTSLKNVSVLRTRQDAEFILSAGKCGSRCVCIGGGILGLETAGALARRGVQVTVVENMAWLLSRQLNQKAGALFQAHLGALGIQVCSSARVKQLVGEAQVSGVALEDGAVLPADLVVISAGVRSNLEAAREAGVVVNQGILVDDAMRTSHPDIFAAGDVAEHRGVLYGTWAPSQAQGSVAGANAAGQTLTFGGLPRSNTLKVLGIDLFSIGRVTPAGPADRLIDAEIDGNYYSFVFCENQLVGCILLGDASQAQKIKKMIEEHTDCTALLQNTPGIDEILRF
jgi:nitrite reductase (NADH) large subunit